MNNIYISIIFFLILHNSASANEVWKRLLHFKGGNSQVNNSIFFKSKDGHTNAQSEYLANRNLLKKTNTYQIKKYACQFPARLLILSAELPELKKMQCAEFLTWKDSLAVSSISVVFTTQFLSNPASAFGHTFLRLRSNQRDENLNMTVNYAAEIPKDVSLFTYISKGLFGGFEGSFSLVPLYLKKQEYRVTEMRDLVEFELNLNNDQVELILAHLWELDHSAEFSYFFLDDNCSKKLIDILAVAIPGLETPEPLIYLSPLETIKVLQKNNLIKNKYFFPSVFTQFLAQYRSLTSDEKRYFKRKIRKEKFDLFADLQIDYYEYLRLKNQGVMPKENVPLYNHALVARSKITDSVKEDIPIPNIEKATAPRKITTTTEYDKKDWSTYLSFRPALHEVSDRNDGYLKYSTLNFLQTKVRLRKEKVELQEFQFAEIAKFSTLNILDSGPSWKVGVSLNRDENMGNDKRLVQRNEFSFGYGFELSNNIQYFVMLKESILTGNVHKHLQLEHQALVKIIFDFEKFKILLNPLYTFRSKSQKYASLSLLFIYYLSPSFNLAAQSNYQSKFLPFRNSLSVSYYF